MACNWGYTDTGESVALAPPPRSREICRQEVSMVVGQPPYIIFVDEDVISILIPCFKHLNLCTSERRIFGRWL